MSATETATATANNDVRLRQIMSAVLAAEIQEQGITVYEAVKRAGLKQSTGRDVFGGMSIPKLGTVLALEGGLGRPAGWLSQQAADRLAAV